MIESAFDNELTSLVDGDISSKTFLLGVSGGIDSICMAEMFYRSSLSPKFAIAHVNFSLRGIDSELDMEFVSSWAAQRNIPFYSKVADTYQYVEENSVSTQMAARDIRYKWFGELMAEHQFDYLAIAHNLNDNAETMLLNMLRGSGLKGIAGIPAKNGRIIRPLMNFTREEIQDFVSSNGIIYRDDITNFESHYARNKVRNIIFPEFKQLNPSFLSTLHKDSYYLRQASAILDELYAQKREKIVVVEPDRVLIDKQLLMTQSHPEYWLYRILSEYEFNSAQAEDVFRSVQTPSVGKLFYSISHKLVVDRGTLNIYPLEDNSTVKFVVRHPGKFHFKGRSLIIKIYPKPKVFSPKSKIEGLLFLDADKVTFPILCRTWNSADRFRPLGMRKGEKKLSDFFIDEKLDRHQKENVPIFISKNKIVALLGMRPDDRYKITPRTKNIMEIRLIPMSAPCE